MKHSDKKQKVRNFVAKNATVRGAGRHTNKKKDYNRQQEKRLAQSAKD